MEGLSQEAPEALHDDLEVVGQGVELLAAACDPGVDLEDVLGRDNVRSVFASSAFQLALANLEAWVESVCE